MPRPKAIMVSAVCDQCGAFFTHKPWLKTVRFCSWACVKAARAEHTSIVTCAQCGEPFRKYDSQPNQRFCSISCAMTARNLTDQNPAYHRNISGDKNPMYGKGLHGPDNPMYGRTGSANPGWKGGRKVRKDGYILVIAPPGHPYPADTSGYTAYILEHRFVMEQHIGRYLRPEEVVHHIDGNPTNNAIENLQLFTNQAEHIRVAHPKSGRAGPLSNLWRGGHSEDYGPNWAQQRRAARKRDRYTCQDCGITEREYGQELEVHHIRRFASFVDYQDANELENLISLCRPCHVRIEQYGRRR